MILSRRDATAALLLTVLGAGTPALAQQPAVKTVKQRSYTATHGHARFLTADLLPGDTLDLSRVNLSAPDAQVVALTFDDGPSHNDLRILDTLAALRIEATFFEIGERAAARPDIVRAIAAAGHEIGNHSQNHIMMSDAPPGEQAFNLHEADRILTKLGVEPHWFRPPFGDFDAVTVAQARREALRPVLWTVDSKDWKGLDTAAVKAQVIPRLRPGAVVLMHSTKPASTAALFAIVAAGRERGLRFVTISHWYRAMR